MTSELRVRLARRETGLSPLVKYFYWPFQCGASMSFLSWFYYAYVHVCLIMPCGHLLEKGWPLSSRIGGLTVSLSSWFRYGAWLYGSLIIAQILTLSTLSIIKLIFWITHVLTLRIRETPKRVFFLQTVKTLMKCSIMLHFIWVYTIFKGKEIFRQKDTINFWKS